MGLSGSLRTLSLAEICQTLNRSQATGILRLSSPIGGRDLVFDQGEVIQIVARGEGQQHSLLQRLGALGLLDQAAVGRGTSGGYATIQNLVRSGQLSREQVDEALGHLVQDEFVNVFTWTSANFLFREASDNDPEAARIVAEARDNPVRTTMNSLLMEAARRQDEWQEIHEFLPSDDDVPVVVEGREQDFLERGQTFPAKPVVELITGYHSFEDIYRLAPLPRMEVQFVVYELMSEGLVKILSVDEMVGYGQANLQGRRPDIAAQLFRRALALDRGREDVVAMLAHSLELVGNSPDAAGCYGQLALTYLGEGRGLDAVAMARRAREIDPGDAQVMILVRCLLDLGNADEAAAELIRLATTQAEAGALDEARSTCRKALEVQPENEAARRELARILRLGGEAGLGDEIVVCVACGETNDREATHCHACKALLQISCLSCGRAVAASDHICIFCGADPHDAKAKADRMAAMTEAPATDSILSGAQQRPEGSIDTASWHADLRSRVSQARALEDKLRYQEALTVWKEIAHGEVANEDLDRHIRELEGLIHDREIERFIERGHRFRDGRAYYRAAGFYRRAQRCMHEDDPRAERLAELVESCNRLHRVSALAYALAFLFLGVAAYLALEPRWRRDGFLAEIAAASEKIDNFSRDPDLMQYRKAADVLTAIRARATELDLADQPKVQEQIGYLSPRVGNLRFMAAKSLLTEAEQHLTARPPMLAAAEAALLQIEEDPDLERALGSSFIPVKQALTAAQEAARSDAEALKELPKKLEAAQAEADAGRLAQALAAFAGLSHAADPAIAAQAATQVTMLEKRKADFGQKAAAIEAGAQSDLRQALAVASDGAFLAEVVGWDQQGAWEQRKQAWRERLDQAKTAWSALGREPDMSAMRTFIAQHAGTPEVAEAQARVARLEQDAHQRAKDLAQSLNDYRQAQSDRRLDLALRAAQRLHDRFPAEAKAEKVLYPVRFETGVAEVLVSHGPTAVGRTGADGVLEWAYEPGLTGTIRFEREGFEPAEVDAGQLSRDYRCALPLARSILWLRKLDGQILHLRAMGDGLLVQAGRDLLRLDGQGQPVWSGRVPLGERGDLAGRSLGELARLLPDGRIVAVSANDEVLVVDPAGGIASRARVGMQIQDSPALFIEEFTGREYLAAAGPLLAMGQLAPGESELKRHERIANLRAGPFILPTVGDQLVVVVNPEGRVDAYKGSDLTPAWTGGLGASFTIDILQTVAVDAFVVVIDEETASRYQLSGEGITKRWSKQVPRNALTPVTVMGDRVVVAGDGVVKAFDAADGAERIRVEVGSTLVGAAAAAGGLCCYGVATDGGHALVMHDGRSEQWRRALPAKPLCSRFTDSLVVTGLADGSVVALRR